MNFRRPDFGTLTRTFAATGTVWIFLLMVLICSDVLARGAFSRPILGVPEMVQFSIVGIVFLQLPETLRAGGLTRSDALLGRLVERLPRVGHLLQLLYHAVGAALFVVVLVTTWPLMVQAYRDGDFYGSTGVVQIPTWPLKAIILAGCAAMVVQFVLFAWRDLSTALGRRTPDTARRQVQ